MQEMDLENRYRTPAAGSDSVQVDVMRRILQDHSNNTPAHHQPLPTAQPFDSQSIREVVSNQMKSVMQELNHRDDNSQQVRPFDPLLV